MNRKQLKIRPLATAITAVLLGLAGNNVLAMDYQGEEVTVRVDTTVSYGASWRMEDPEDDNLGKSYHNPATFLLPNSGQRAQLGRWSNNGDDGNQNYDKGDLVSHAVKLTIEADLSWRNFGAFTRATAFYDFANTDTDFLSKKAEDLVGKNHRLLDAYIWGEHDVGGHFLNWRYGKQVVSWGESTFIQGGINVINPVDVSALRVAGAELKEAYLPINLGWLTFDVTDNVAIEALYLFDYQEIEPDPAGSFFASNDFAVPGGAYAMLGFATVPQPVLNSDLYATVCGQGQFGASDIGLPPQLVGAGCSVALPRGATPKPEKYGQYGLALRWFAPELNDTEFGFYYLNYTSRLPLISGTAVRSSALSSATYFTEYPSDIEMVGVSFNTTIGTYSVAGEWSYRNNAPLQIDDVEVLFSGLSPLNAAIPEEVLRFRSQLGEFAPGEYIQGWERHDVNQFQVTVTKLFGPNNPFKADQIVAVTEAGYTYVADLPSWDVLRYNGPGTDTGGGADFLTGAMRNPETETGGFADDDSWGYRFVTRFDYNNAIGAWTVSPRLGWAHDVNGTSPGPGGNFIDGRKSLTLGLAFDYLNVWLVDFAYTMQSGAGKYNEMRDRDFLSASVRYSF